MSTHQNYEYGDLGFTLTLEQRQELVQLRDDIRSQYNVTPSQSGLAQPLYDKLLGFMSPPGQGVDDVYYTEEYLKVYTWIDGARDVNLGEGVFATYIHNYTANQYRLRFGEIDQGVVADRVNEASNAIGLTLVERILDNNGLLPSLEGIGAVDGGDSARLVFQNPEYYPEGDYTGWAGTLLFSFMGYDRFFREWLLDEHPVTAILDVGNGEPLQRTIKQFEGSYDLFAALQAHQETVEQYSLWEQVLAWWPSTLDSDQSDLIQATHDYVTRLYDLGADHAFKAGNLLPFVSATTYLGNDLGIRVGSLGDDVIDAYWPSPDKHFIVHGGEGDDTIYVPPYADFGGSALIDGGTGYDTLIYANSAVLSPLHITLEAVGGDSLYPWRYSIVRQEPASTEEAAFVYSVEYLEASSGADWLSIQYGGPFEADILVDMAGQGQYGNTLDFSRYQAGVELGMSANGGISLLVQAPGEEQPLGGALSFWGVRNIIGTAFDDTLVGNALDNIIDAGDGQNALWGGGGVDTFIVDQGSNRIMDADADDRLVIRLPMADSGKMLVLGGGMLLKAQVAGPSGQPVELAEGQAAYFHPVQPDPINYSPGLGGLWPLLDESLGEEFIIRYSLSGSDLNISASFLEGEQTSFAEISVVDYQDGDLGLSFSELIVPNYTNAAGNQKPIEAIIDEFEQAHFDLLQDWAPPPGFADVWYAA